MDTGLVATSAVHAPDGAWHAAWVSALDRLELDVDAAERLLRETAPLPLPVWTPPPVRGPLPEDLVPRAQLLLERQLAAARDVALTAASTRRQLAMAVKVAETTPPEVPVYLDITA